MTNLAPELLSMHYTSKSTKIGVGGILDRLFEQWRGLPHRRVVASHNQVELALNEILFEYNKNGEAIDVRKYREMNESERQGHEKTLKENGFLTLVLTMRNRALMRNRMDSEQDSGRSWSSDYPALYTLLKEWKKQETQPYKPDRVMRVLSSNPLTRRCDFLAVARMELIRRIRCGTKIGAVNLTVAEQLQEFTDETFQSDGLDPDEWVYTCPNSALKAYIKLQGALTNARKSDFKLTLQNTDDIRILLEDEDFELKPIIMWWTHYIDLRSFLSRCLRGKIEEKQRFLDEIQSTVPDEHREYLEELRVHEDMTYEKEDCDYTAYHSLRLYHDGLCSLDLINRNPSINNYHAWPRHLMYAIVSAEGGMDEIKVDSNLSLDLHRLSEADLMRKIDKTITNGLLLVDAAKQRNSHLTTIKLLLIVVDVLARIRNALGQPRIAIYPYTDRFLITWDGNAVETLPDLNEWNSESLVQLREWGRIPSGKRATLFCPITRLQFAERYRQELIDLLTIVKASMDGGEEDGGLAPIDFIGDCIDSLDNYQLLEKLDVTGDTNGRDGRTGLGELGHLCGSFIGLPIIDPIFDANTMRRTEGTTLVLNGIHRKLGGGYGVPFQLESNPERDLIINPEDGRFNPYVGPAGESRAALAIDTDQHENQ